MKRIRLQFIAILIRLLSHHFEYMLLHMHSPFRMAWHTMAGLFSCLSQNLRNEKSDIRMKCVNAGDRARYQEKHKKSKIRIFDHWSIVGARIFSGSRTKGFLKFCYSHAPVKSHDGQIPLLIVKPPESVETFICVTKLHIVKVQRAIPCLSLPPFYGAALNFTQYGQTSKAKPHPMCTLFMRYLNGGERAHGLNAQPDIK